MVNSALSILLLAILLINLFSSASGTQKSYQDELNLHRHLESIFSTYNTDLRPVKNATTDVVFVDVKVTMSEFFFYVEEMGRARLLLRISMAWRDLYITWDPERFSGVNVTHLDVSHHWLPTLELQSLRSGVKGGQMMSDPLIPTIAHHDGTLIRTKDCVVDLVCGPASARAAYPNDGRECYAGLDIWPYDSNEVQLNIQIGVVPNNRIFISPGGWWVYNVTTRNEPLIDPDEDTDLGLKYQISKVVVTLRRWADSPVRVANSVFPFLCCVLPVLFYLHPGHAIRILLAMLQTSLLSMQLLQLSSLPTIMFEDPHLNFPTAVRLLVLLLGLAFIQLVWFFEAYHLSAQLPSTAEPGPGCTRIFLMPPLSHFIRHYLPLRIAPPVAMPPPTYQESMRTEHNTDDPERPPAAPLRTFQLIHDSGSNNKNKKTYTAWQLVCICVDYVLFFCYVLICGLVLLVFLFFS